MRRKAHQLRLDQSAQVHAGMWAVCDLGEPAGSDLEYPDVPGRRRATDREGKEPSVLREAVGESDLFREVRARPQLPRGQVQEGKLIAASQIPQKRGGSPVLGYLKSVQLCAVPLRQHLDGAGLARVADPNPGIGCEVTVLVGGEVHCPAVGGKLASIEGAWPLVRRQQDIFPALEID